MSKSLVNTLVNPADTAFKHLVGRVLETNNYNLLRIKWSNGDISWEAKDDVTFINKDEK